MGNSKEGKKIIGTETIKAKQKTLDSYVVYIYIYRSVM